MADVTGEVAPRVEFIALVALTTSLVAMSIDTMLPALGTMASELGAAHENDRQLILIVFFAGMSVGSGFVFGGFIGYLSMSQQVFQEQYGLGTLFPVFFGLLASAIGLSSFVNGKLVMRFGMRRLSRLALSFNCALCVCALLGSMAFAGHPPLLAFVCYMLLCFFCNGLLFGNFSARGMEPMGHIAGVAAAVNGSISGLVALGLGTIFGRAYDGTVLPVVAGFTTSALLALVATELAERGAPSGACSALELRSVGTTGESTH